MWIFLIACIQLMLLGCDLFSQTTALTVFIPKVSEKYALKELDDLFARKVSFIDEGGITHISVHGSLTSPSSVLIHVKKNHVMPVLVCSNIIQSNQESSSDNRNCLFSWGGVYPFDGNDSTLYVETRHKAQVADFLLDMYEKRVDIALFNVSKLYASIQSRSPDAPFDTYRVYDYLNEDKMSSWGIKPLNTFSVQLPHETLSSPSRRWINLSFWGDALIGDDFAIDLYPGKWVFVSRDETDVHLMHVYVDTTGNYLLLPPYNR